MRRLLMLAVAVVCAGLAVASFASPPRAGAQEDQVAQGRGLFLEGCSACHGDDARGVPGKGPSLIGVGALSANFYVETGRMPLDQPKDEPVRSPPAYSRAAREAIIAYVASLGGPGVPRVDVSRGNVAEGKRTFTEHCAGCHQAVARGGVLPPEGVAPPLQEASATQVVQAIRIGPFTMPRFSSADISSREAESLAKFVVSTRDPDNRGGWGIGNIGPVTEGMVAWLLAGTALVIILRLLGTRET